jgi:protein-tyrosine phosphatase
LKKGVHAALPVIEGGSAVLVHCKAGVHRSVAMASCVLIGKGYTADEAMQLIKEKRAVADPDVGYIQKRIRKFERQWPNQSNPDGRLDGA